jgi:hypothetical protein
MRPCLCPNRVKGGKTLSEYMFSVAPQIPDLGNGGTDWGISPACCARGPNQFCPVAAPCTLQDPRGISPASCQGLGKFRFPYLWISPGAQLSGLVSHWLASGGG